LDKEFLKAGNPRKIISCYSMLLGDTFTRGVEAEIAVHTTAIFALATSHFEFAERQRSSEWRQKISRYYYACYNGSKALRFQVDGAFSADVSDHKKVGELPSDFPNRDYYKNKMESMRTDRNSCDYDHAVMVADLLDTPENIGQFTRDFLDQVKAYCNARGLSL